MGEIKATTRNRALGLLADIAQGGIDFASKPFGFNNPPVQGLLALTPVQAIANTLNEASYSGLGALGTGSGMTWKPKADTVDAAMTLIPGSAAAGNAVIKGGVALAKKAAPAIERAVPRIMERGGLPAQLLGDMSQGTISPATVWHGSPHKFDKFDASKIGTGEGAQAYGHGLYLAEAQDVGKGYQQATSKDRFITSDGYFDPSQLEHLNVRAATRKGDLDKAIEEARKYAAPDPDYPETAAKAARDLVKLEQVKASGGMTPNEGYLYKVDLPDDAIAKMLDWDKPLSQQHPDVQKALAMLDRDTWHPSSDDYDAAELGQSIYQRLTNQGRDYAITAGQNAQTTLGASQAKAAEDLRAFGIPGIRYLDGGSRGTGAGTSNFVVFPGNEGLLTILERNGQQVNPPPLGLLR